MRIRHKVWLEKNGRMLFGKGRAEILRAIEEEGSLLKAAARLKMSYRAAWGKLRASEEHLGIKLVERSPGGRHGMKLTAEGRLLLGEYDRLLAEAESFFGDYLPHFTGEAGARKRAPLLPPGSEGRLLEALERGGVGLALTDADDRFSYVNAALVRIHGRRPQDLLGRTWRDLVPAEAVEATREEVERCLRSGQVYRTELLSFQENGQVGCVRVTAVPLLGEGGRYSGHVGIVQDISRRKWPRIEEARDITGAERAELALLGDEAKLRAITQDETELVCRFLPDSRLTYVNGAYCRTFHKRREDLIGRSFLGLIPEEFHEKVKEHLASLTPERSVATHEHQVVGPEGEERWQQWTNRAVFDEGGRPIAFQSVGRDVTEVKRAEQSGRAAAGQVRGGLRPKARGRQRPGPRAPKG